MLPQFLIFVIFGTPRIIHDFARYAKKCENLRQKIALRQNSLLVYLVFLMAHLMSLGWCLIFSSPAKLVDFVNIINFENAVHMMGFRSFFELSADVMEWMRWVGGSYPLDCFDH